MVSGHSPNVIVIISDDHGYADRSALGIRSDVRTPGLDRLRGEGVECTSAYVTAPICSASRSAIIAGQHQGRWGGQWFEDSSFPYHRDSLAERFKELGYRTGYFGKVHYGKEDVGDRACPPHHGFDVSYYGLAGKQTGRLHYLHHRSVDDGNEMAAKLGQQPMLDGDTEIPFDGFLTNEFGERTRQFITSAHDDQQPFFAIVAFNAVHNFCWQLPPDELRKRGLPEGNDWQGSQSQDYLDWYDGSITPNLEHGREYYAAQLELMDREIELLLDNLDDLDLTRDTVVVYLTDNGGSRCNYADNAPLRGGKYTLFEGGVRVPMLWRWPAAISGGRRVDDVFSSMDLYPTLLAAAGAEERAIADCDGMVQLPALVGESTGSGHEVLHWDAGFQWAVREGSWKLIFVDDQHPHAQGVLSLEHTDPGHGFMLFNLADDPGETTDLSDARPDLVEQLRQSHEVWRSGTFGRDRLAS